MPDGGNAESAARWRLGDEKVDRLRDDVREPKGRMAAVEQNLAGVHRRIDRVELRIERTERRLDLADAPH